MPPPRQSARDPRSRGRRPAGSGTREAIAAAARAQFGLLGYDRTSMRSVALEAGVDPTLVSHFYGSKQQLFVTVVDLPFDAGAAVGQLLDGPRAGIGRRLADFVLDVLEQPEGRARMTGLVRAAAAEDAAAELVRRRVSTEFLHPLAAGLGVDASEQRAALVASQVVGLVMARYVVRLEPLARLSPEAVAAAVAPTFQRYLTGRDVIAP